MLHVDAVVANHKWRSNELKYYPSLYEKVNTSQTGHRSNSHASNYLYMIWNALDTNCHLLAPPSLGSSRRAPPSLQYTIAKACLGRSTRSRNRTLYVNVTVATAQSIFCGPVVFARSPEPAPQPHYGALQPAILRHQCLNRGTLVRFLV
jgi:hypothetical protein